jgi:hypothetical protein
MRSLGAGLIDDGMRLATGLGVGVGNAVFTGAVECILSRREAHIAEKILLRPFPQAVGDHQKQADVWEEFRRELIGASGVALFLFGNKTKDGKVVPADGMQTEYEIARELGVTVLPIGATGSKAEELANLALSDPDSHLSTLDAQSRSLFLSLCKPVTSLQELVAPLLSLLVRVRATTQV